MGRFIDITGQRFGRLVVVGKIEQRSQRGHILWECCCDCGKIVVLLSGSLAAGNTKSCGCLRTELQAKRRPRKTDLTGRRFGSLVVMGEDINSPKGQVYWTCLCDCGKRVRYITTLLLSGRKTNCGCKWINFLNLEGQTFGRLTVASRVTSPEGDANIYWFCKCICGNMVTASATSLRRGTTKSCGCYHSERVREAHTKHGYSDVPEYAVWAGMLQRCTNSKAEGYQTYGGRGITVCFGWRTFINFYNDMGPRPNSDHQIERLDNNGNYSCGHCEGCTQNGWTANCAWRTRKENNQNKRDNRFLEFRGLRQTISQWADLLDISHEVIRTRDKRGWSIERIFTTPIAHKGKPASIIDLSVLEHSREIPAP